MAGLILKSPLSITSPPAGTPNIFPPAPIAVTPFMSFAARDLVASIADSAAVSSLIMGGAAPLVDRTFNTKIAGAGFPLLRHTGGPSDGARLSFDKTQQLSATFNTASIATVAQPLTYSMVARINSLTNLNFARLIGGRTGFQQNIFPTTTAGRITLDFSSSINIDGWPTTEWTRFTVVVNDAVSLYQFGDFDPVAVDLGSASYKGITLGASSAATGTLTTGLDGDFAELNVYAAALTAQQISDLHDYYAYWHGL